MKELVLSYEDTEQLKLVIESTYFTKGNMGKKTENIDCLTVSKGDTIHTVLDGMSYTRVKIKNRKIDGTLSCDIIGDNGEFILRPASEICVKEHKKYTFY